MSVPREQPPRVPGTGTLWVLATVFIVYGTMLPFELADSRAVVLDHLTRIPLNPLRSPDTGEWTTVSDLLQNVLLFVPFGLFAALSLGTDARPRVGVAVALAAGLSATVELLQLGTTGRVTAPADLLTNAAGAWAGARLARPAAQAWGQCVQSALLARWATRPAAFAALLALLILSAGALVPLDVTVDTWALWWKVRLWLLYPSQFSQLRTEPLEAVRAAVAVALLAAWARQAGAARPVAHAVGLVMLLVLGLEAAKLGVESRMPGLAGVAAGLLGAVAGGLASVMAHGAAAEAGAPHTRPRVPLVAVRGLVLLGTVAGVVVLCASASRCDVRELALVGVALGAAAVPWGRAPQRGVLLGALAGAVVLLPPLYAQAAAGGLALDLLGLAAGTAGAAAGAWAATSGQVRYQRLAGCWTSREPIAR